MPYHEPDPTDPSMLVGNVVECRREELREMAAALAAELAQSGCDAGTILGIFRDASYSGPHLAWGTLGEDEVRELIDEAVAFWSRCRFVVKDARPPRGDEGPLLSVGPSDRTCREEV